MVTSSSFGFSGVATRWCCDTIVTSVLFWGNEQLGAILRGCQEGWGPLGDYDGQGGGLAPTPVVGVKDFPV